MNSNPSGENLGVNILDPQQLLECAQDKTAEGRRNLAQAVSSFFDNRILSDHEKELASEILLNLIRQAERDLREALSERLSLQENIPAELIVFLANDEISVAEPVLQHSPVLNDVDLIYIITSRGEEHWKAIAGRGRLSPNVTDRLIDTGNTETLLTLVGNEKVSLQKNAMRRLVKCSMQSEELQVPLLGRPEVDPEIAIDLYMVVSEELRRHITQKFQLSSHVIDEAMEGLIHELSTAAKGDHTVSPEMRALAARFRERQEITADLLIKTLRRGQVGFFIALFAERVGLLPENIVKLIQKDGGKSFVVICRFIGMMKSEFASIFLLSRNIRTSERIVDQRELAHALKNFDAIKDFDVERIMKSWHANQDLI